MSRGPNINDLYFRKVLETLANAASELRAVLPKELAEQLDWDALERDCRSLISPKLRERESDLIFRTKLAGRSTVIYILIEHQSQPDPLMPFRMLEYMVQIWNRWLADQPKTPKPKKVPLIIPLVVHAGRRARWTGPTELLDVIDADPVALEKFGAYLPRFRFLLDDVCATKVDALRERPLTVPVFALLMLLTMARPSRNAEVELNSLIDHMLDAPEGSFDDEDLKAMAGYILNTDLTSDEIIDTAFARLGSDAKEIVMTIADTLRAEGRVQERVDMLLKLLASKFGRLPKQTIVSIKSADAAKLGTWFDRALTANHLEEVLHTGS
ncbi:hypothetical protein D5S18_18350 [Nocardia panacis]|uniref:Transposase (putative) YhgA-like domain-containing protein n=1 Tax=Nocardia panacis TaxID=2340916 RepID=A0A3A4KI95_9NOCA|nr:Rpn family recombination-promoting nuclease/putative transposase [Nocardia panacis]RJO74115.1 hypothetical protein D5S18_18350 [Nocardia panacis]